MQLHREADHELPSFDRAESAPGLAYKYAET